MLIDMHMHEMTYSRDSFLKLDEIVRIARERGLDAICITDHDSMGLKEYAAEYSKKADFPILWGLSFSPCRAILSHLESRSIPGSVFLRRNSLIS